METAIFESPVMDKVKLRVCPKTLSMGRGNNAPENQHRSQIDHSVVMLQLLFPAHQQTTELVMPCMCAFHYPAARRMLLPGGDRNLGTRGRPQMQHVVTFPETCQHRGPVVARVQAQMLHAIDF